MTLRIAILTRALLRGCLFGSAIGIALATAHVTAWLDEEKTRANLDQEYRGALALLAAQPHSVAPCAFSPILYVRAMQLADRVGEREHADRLLKQAQDMTISKLEACLDVRPVSSVAGEGGSPE